MLQLHRLASLALGGGGLPAVEATGRILAGLAVNGNSMNSVSCSWGSQQAATGPAPSACVESDSPSSHAPGPSMRHALPPASPWMAGPSRMGVFRFNATAALATQAAQPTPRLASLPSEDPSSQSPDEFRAEHGMVIEDRSGRATPAPYMSFSDAGFPEALMGTVLKAGYKRPTPIQAQAWPIISEGRDLVAIANTGSGKTAGFLVPALAHIREATRAAAAEGRTGGRVSGARVLVLAPTRELARQIEVEALKFGMPLGLRTACLFGGAARYQQLSQIMRHPHIVVATPGRLLDFVEGGELDVTKVSYLVLDEADRMLDMGFEPQLKQLDQFLPSARQTLFFSATWPSEVQGIAARFARNQAVKLFVGKVSDRPVAATSITQLIKITTGPEKIHVLQEYLASKPQGARIIIFTSTKMRCDWLAHNLSAASGHNPAFNCVTIHGDKTQRDRDSALRSFKMGRVPILIATDVASRGLDISDVASVINFDAPNDPESYVHRIGRTGRAGATGESLTLLTRADEQLAPKLARVMREAGQEVPEELEAMVQATRKSPPRSGSNFRSGGGGRGGGGGGGQRYGRDRGGFGRR